MPLSNDEVRSNRIMAGKLRLLYRGTTAILTNLVIGSVVASLLWDHYPHGVLTGWLLVVLCVCAARILLQRRFRQASAPDRCNNCWAIRFSLGTFASGLLWGVLCLGLPFWGQRYDYVLMTVAAAGMSAGALATISAYLPAYTSYTGAFLIPLIIVCLSSPDKYIVGTGAMILVYLFAISVTAVRSSTFMGRTVALQVDNEILRDNLKRTRIERDTARNEKWSTLAQLSHELRTPLNAILGFSEAMREEFFGPMGNARYRVYADHVHTSGRHLLRLTDRLLEVSQGEAGELELDETEIDLSELVRTTLTVVAPEAEKCGLSLITEAPSHLPRLRGDKAKLRQILVNLLDNAIKFTPAGGRITITLQQRGGLELIVADTGIGIHPEGIPLALRPFGRLATPLKRNAEGPGLGLPICKRLAEVHGATLSIASEPGKGTVCRVTFPATRSVPLPEVVAA